MAKFNATPYVVAGGVFAAVLAGLWWWRRSRAQAGGGPVPIAIALGTTPGFNTPAVLNSIYDASNFSLIYNPARPPELNTLTALTPGSDYIVITNINTTATIGQITYIFIAILEQRITFTP